MKILETNVGVNTKFKDNYRFTHQTRVIEVPSWEEYCDLFKNYDGTPFGDEYKVCSSDLYGEVHGNCVPKDAKIIKLDIDKTTLFCTIITFNGNQLYKRVCILEE